MKKMAIAPKDLRPDQVKIDQLVDIGSIKIDPNASVPEKLQSFINQIGNPYLYRCGKVIVKVSYTDTPYTLEDRLEQYIRQRQASDRTVT